MPERSQKPGERSDRRRSARGLAAALGLGLMASLACVGSESPEEARERAERGISPLVSRAERSRAQGEFDDAIENYQRAFDRTPWNTRLKRALALTHTERAQDVRNEGKLSDAEADLRRALELYPEDPDFRRNLAVVLIERAQSAVDDRAAQAMLQEIRALDPGLEVPERVALAGMERRLDLAFELLERGQLEAGIDRLEGVRRDYPGKPEVVRLLAQAKVRLAGSLASRENFEGAGGLLDEAVSLYDEIRPCDGRLCSREELRTAHYNRCVVRINARQDALARAALDAALERGFRYEELENALRL